VRDLQAVQDDYRLNSCQLTLEEWRKQPLRSTLLDNLARPSKAVQ
jgi:cardiolipin synthase A/B